jgi:hypothetical protein
VQFQSAYFSSTKRRIEASSIHGSEIAPTRLLTVIFRVSQWLCSGQERLEVPGSMGHLSLFKNNSLKFPDFLGIRQIASPIPVKAVVMKVGERIKQLALERDSQIEFLLKKGTTYQMVAEQVACSIGQVQYIAKKTGLLKSKRSS